jgi:hypothetical protein
MEVSGQLHAPAALPPRERATDTHWTGGWVGPRAVLDAVVKRKIPSPHRESNPDLPIVQPIASRYTDWAIPAHKIISDIISKYPAIMEANSVSTDIYRFILCSEVERAKYHVSIVYMQRVKTDIKEVQRWSKRGPCIWQTNSLAQEKGDYVTKYEEWNTSQSKRNEKFTELWGSEFSFPFL